MKKIKFLSLILVAVMLSCVFAGCTAADSATIQSIQSKFSVDVKEYLRTDERVNSAIIEQRENGTYDMIYAFSFNTQDNVNLAFRIGLENWNGESNLYYNLSNKKEYNELLTRGSKYFFSKFMSTIMDTYQQSYSKIDQEKLTELYSQVENVLDEIKEFGKKYRDLDYDYVNGNEDSLGTSIALDNLFKQYKNLIGAVLEMNLATLDIYDNSLFEYVDLSADGAKVPATEIDRLVDAFELYTTEYLYQRYMICGDEVDMHFIDGELMTALKNLVNKSKTNRTSRNSNKTYAVDDKTTYVYLRTIENAMDETIELNRHSAQTLKTGLPETSASDYNYKKAIYDSFTAYETTLIRYINQISTLIDLIVEY